MYDVMLAAPLNPCFPPTPSNPKDVQYNTEHQCGVIVPQGVDIWSDGRRPEAYRDRDHVEYQSGTQVRIIPDQSSR